MRIINKSQPHYRSKYPVEYQCWSGMKARCKQHNKYHQLYFDRGITVCAEWKSFLCFLADMGQRPSSLHSLDRIDNNKGYCKENCRWALRSTQNFNKRKQRFTVYFDKRHNRWKVNEFRPVVSGKLSHAKFLASFYTEREAQLYVEKLQSSSVPV